MIDTKNLNIFLTIVASSFIISCIGLTILTIGGYINAKKVTDAQLELYRKQIENQGVPQVVIQRYEYEK